MERLTQRMGMPGCTGAGLEGDAGAIEPRRSLGHDDRILQHHAGEVFGRRAAPGPGTGEMDVHDVPPWWLCLRGRIARLGLGVHSIETTQPRASVRLLA